MTEYQEIRVKPLPPNKEKIKKLWTVAAILGVITAFEFLVAFSIERGVMKTSIFVLMTIVKAAYIVGEFMHLRYESKVLLWSILIPLIFIIWLIVALLYEGNYFLGINFLS